MYHAIYKNLGGNGNDGDDDENDYDDDDDDNNAEINFRSQK